MKIICLQEIDSTEVREKIREIFFETSSIKEFTNIEEEKKFYQRWVGNYIDSYPEHFFIALDEEGTVVGYLCGHPDSKLALNEFKNPGTELFVNHFADYPAHLHINFTANAQGKGLGRNLVNHYVEILKNRGISGVHIVTTKDSRNVSFYTKNSFLFNDSAQFKGHTLFFMGRII